MKFFNKKRITISSKNEGRMPLKNVMDGSILTRDSVVDQLPYVLFLTLIAVLYIGNRYHAEKIVRQTNNIQSTLKELRAESITSASRLMFISKQSEVARLVNEKGLDLKEAVEPPQKLVIDSNE
ncbi:MAG: FtsL-like putative cell division protein [Salinivirgaceae bacterium]|jgi:hypothetical protein|nr:FtsL-like putative cell division protein [Salinivirgaceae bacterium]